MRSNSIIVWLMVLADWLLALWSHCCPLLPFPSPHCCPLLPFPSPLFTAPWYLVLPYLILSHLIFPSHYICADPSFFVHRVGRTARAGTTDIVTHSYDTMARLHRAMPLSHTHTHTHQLTHTLSFFPALNLIHTFCFFLSVSLILHCPKSLLYFSFFHFYSLSYPTSLLFYSNLFSTLLLPNLSFFLFSSRLHFTLLFPHFSSSLLFFLLFSSPFPYSSLSFPSLISPLFFLLLFCSLLST